MGSVPSRRKEIRVMLTVVVKTSIAVTWDDCVFR